MKIPGQEQFLPNPKARLRDQFHEVARFKHLSLRTEQTYWDWVVRFLKFHRNHSAAVTDAPLQGWKRPQEMGAGEVRNFLAHLAVTRNVAASTQNQALNALVFLYR
ncbi:MAG TPA: site-specific integrase, partial [Candidatus Paceibacterota bacterium]|nr:site-specific integrase [Candidatus Paceibacterota bacterium]